MTMAKRVAFTPMTSLLRHLGCMFLETLARSGLLRLPQRWGGEGAEEEPSEESGDYVLVMDGGTPSLVHVHVLTPLIKKKVPVVEYREFIERQRCSAAAGEAEEVRCAVCLSGVEEKDEIRELWNCSHVFHRQCLDCWVDLGHVTCPLCRSLLLPPSSNTGMMRTAAAASASPSRQGGREDNELETRTD